MAKNVAKTATRAVAQQGQRNAFQEYSDETKQGSSIEGDLLRFTKQGDWVAGQEQTELPEGTELIMGINTLKVGWQKWEDQKPVDSRMGLKAEGYRPPSRDELGDNDEDKWEEYDGEPRDPWQKTSQCQLLDPSTGQVYTYVTSSKSGETALGEISGVYGDRLMDGEDQDAVPIVRLASSFYKHKTYGKIMIPVFELTDQWVKPEDVKPKAAPVKKMAVKAKPAAARTNSAQKALPAPKGRTTTGGNRARI
jgi:hypothetical protein